MVTVMISVDLNYAFKTANVTKDNTVMIEVIQTKSGHGGGGRGGGTGGKRYAQYTANHARVHTHLQHARGV